MSKNVGKIKNSAFKGNLLEITRVIKEILNNSPKSNNKFMEKHKNVLLEFK